MAPIPVVGERFCAKECVDLIVIQQIESKSSKAKFQVFDTKGTLMLQVEDSGSSSFHTNGYVRDQDGLPLLCIRNKIMSWHGRWKVHLGETCEENNLLFSVKRSHGFQLKTQLDVFLAANVNEKLHDFRLKSKKRDSDEAFLVYEGDSIIAEMNRIHSWDGFFMGKDVFFNLRIYPGVDYAFVVALFVVLYETTYSSYYQDDDDIHVDHHHHQHHIGHHHHHHHDIHHHHIDLHHHAIHDMGHHHHHIDHHHHATHDMGHHHHHIDHHHHATHDMGHHTTSHCHM